MDARTYLKEYVAQSSPVIREFLDTEIQEAEKISPVTADIVRRFKIFMDGGKRLRGAQIILGYEMFGGRDQQAILKASTVIEIIHAFLLMHDDIMDQDNLRRGAPTIHEQFAELHKKESAKRDGRHYGVSMAIDTGDIGMFLAGKLLASLPFSAEYLLRVDGFLHQLLLEVGYGQALDVTYETYRKLTVDDVLRVHRYKCADYTISGPLIIGGLLAGKSLDELQAFYQYGLPVGIAFQLRDDELGMFSSAKVLGKPADSDLREGKNTVLILHALQKAKGKDREFLQWAHGNAHLKEADVERVRGILTDTGALVYSQKLARKLVEEGKSHIPEITPEPYFQDLLRKMADFMIDRES